MEQASSLIERFGLQDHRFQALAAIADAKAAGNPEREALMRNATTRVERAPPNPNKERSSVLMHQLKTQTLGFLGSPSGKVTSAVAIVLLFIETCVLLSLWVQNGKEAAAVHSVPLPIVFNAQPSKATAGNCILHHVQYLPSRDEITWTAHARMWEPDYCQHLYSYNSTINIWFIYKSACSDGSIKVDEALIEPLFGFLRHPWAECAKTHLLPDTHLLKNHILLGSVQMPSFFHGRLNFYFDMGASTFDAGSGGPSQQWIVDSYKKRGIIFDRLLMWEAGVVDPAGIFKVVPPELQHAYQKKRGITFDRLLMWEAGVVDPWGIFKVVPPELQHAYQAGGVDPWGIFKAVPPELQHAYQYFNVPVGTDFTNEGNPLNIMKRIVKPEDFMVFKIDIDNSDVETKIVDYIMSDSLLPFLIDEMFYEHHVNFHLMNKYWGTDNSPTHIDDSYRIFLSLRKKGIRMHGWP
eukprot:gene6789-30754_t